MAYLAACGSAVAPGDAGGDGTTVTDLVPSDAFRADSFSSDATDLDGSAVRPARTSRVLMNQIAADAMVPRSLGSGYYVVGLFFGNEPPDDSFHYQVNAIGPCEFARWVDFTSVGAGTLTIRNGSRNSALQPIRVDPLRPVYSDGLAETRWVPGERIAVAASGDIAPAFATVVAFPSNLLLTSPAAPADALRVRATDGLALRWAAVSDHVEARIEMQFGDGGRNHGRAVCSFPGTDGSGMIPSALFDALRTAGGVKLYVSTVSRQTLMVGTFPMTVVVENTWFGADIVIQ